MKVLIFTVSVLIISVTHAKSLGVIGATYPVAELSLLKLIDVKLKEKYKELVHFNQEWVKKVSINADRPKALGLQRATIQSTHFYEPKILLKNPIYNNEGKELYPAGTYKSALDTLPFYNPCWLFFDADDKAQMLWAIKQKCVNPKIILTGGAVSEVQEKLQTNVYFDQAGRIVSKLQILTLPAIVTRKNHRLQIDEIVIKENGDEL